MTTPSRLATVCLPLASLLALAAPAPASIVTFDIALNGAAAPVSLRVGDTLSVSLYATVTDNTWIYNGNSVDLGLSLYSVDLDGGSTLRPLLGQDPGKWDAIATLDMGNFDCGYISANKIIQLADGMGVPSTAKSHYAVTRQLLATGTFTAIAPGDLTLSLTSTLANVMKVNTAGSYAYASADTIQSQPSSLITVLPIPEPSSVMLLTGVVMLGLGCRRGRSARLERSTSTAGL